MVPLFALVFVLTGLVFLAGCSVNMGLDTKVETDGSGTVSLRLAADQELQDALSKAGGGLGSIGSLLDILGGRGGLADNIPGSVDELFDTIMGEIPGDWQVERGTDDDGTRWLAMTRPFVSPDELEEILASSALSSVVNVDSLTLAQDDGVFSTKTRFSTTADVSGALSQLGGTALDLPLDLLSQVLVIENRLTLPGTIGENDADEVQGNTLVWNVGTSDAREMHAESVSYNWAAIIGIIVAGGIVIAALVVALVLILLRRRPANPPAAPEASGTGGAPADPTPAGTTATTVAALPLAEPVPAPVETAPAAVEIVAPPVEAVTPPKDQPTAERIPPPEAEPEVKGPPEEATPAEEVVPLEAVDAVEPAGDTKPPEPPLLV
jgi:hypothetical protein